MDEKLLEVLTSPPDGALALVSQGREGPHLVNSWNSYVIIMDDKLIIPAGRMHKTQENIERDERVLLTISNRQVQGKSYRGTGFLVRGRASFDSRGDYYEKIKESFPWARAALVVEILEAQQTL